MSKNAQPATAALVEQTAAAGHARQQSIATTKNTTVTEWSA